MSPAGVRRLPALLLLLACPPPAPAQVLFPKALDYSLRAQSSIQSNSNPAKLASNGPQAGSGTTLVNTIGLAARIPLLSDDTRLDIAGVAGDARFADQPRLNYQPRMLNAALHWRAGRLLAGRVGYQYRRTRYDANRIWPDSDTVDDRSLDAEIGLRVSEDLTLPVLRVYEQKARYETTSNRTLFDRNTRGWEISARYQRTTGSTAAAGFRQAETHYPLRYQLARSGLDDAYQDRELFAETNWQYSVKTGLYARVGLLQRDYVHYPERDTRLLTLDAQVTWQYSPKTDLRLSTWQHPYSDDQDPDILYSIRRGIGLSARWRPTVKTSLSLLADYERQNDKSLTGTDILNHRTQYGSRLIWQVHPNVSLNLEGFRVNLDSDVPWNRYQQNVVRFGINLTTGSGNPQVERMFSPAECRWTYVESDLCP